MLAVVVYNKATACKSHDFLFAGRYTQYYFFANASKTICFGSKSLQIYTLENGGFKLGFWSA